VHRAHLYNGGGHDAAQSNAQEPEVTAEPFALHSARSIVALPSASASPRALTATVRKIAILVYRMLEGDLPQYVDPGPDLYSDRQRQRVLRNLRRTAATLGFQLVTPNTAVAKEFLGAR
jgi:hypothetical protein